MIFKSLFSRKNKEEKPDFEIKLNEAGDWVREENRPFHESIESEVKESYFRINEKIVGLRESLKKFRKAEVDPEVIEKLKRAAKTNKINIERDVEGFLNSIKIPEKLDFYTATEFCLKTLEKIKELSKKNRRTFMIVGEALREDTSTLTGNIGKLEKEIHELVKSLKEKEKRVKNIKESINLAEDLQSDIKRGPDIEKEIKNLKAAIDFQKQKEKKAKRELEELKNSNRMRSLKKNEKKLNEFKKKRKELEERMHQEMSNFEKAFKKMSHEKDFDVMPYVENPVETLTGEESLRELKETMPRIKNNIDGLNLSEKTKNKLLTGIERIDSGVIDWIVKEHEKVSNDLKKLEKKLKEPEIMKDMEEKEEDFKNWSQAIETTKIKINRLDKERGGLSSLISSKKKKLESKLSEVSEKKISVLMEPN